MDTVYPPYVDKSTANIAYSYNKPNLFNKIKNAVLGQTSKPIDFSIRSDKSIGEILRNGFIIICLLVFLILLIVSATRFSMIPKDDSEECSQYFTPKNDITGIVFGSLGTIVFGFLYNIHVK